MKAVQVQVPEKLYEEMQALVRNGWCASEEELLRDALRRYVEAHRPELMERFIREDVEWGLHGSS